MTPLNKIICEVGNWEQELSHKLLAAWIKDWIEMRNIKIWVSTTILLECHKNIIFFVGLSGVFQMKANSVNWEKLLGAKELQEAAQYSNIVPLLAKPLLRRLSQSSRRFEDSILHKAVWSNSGNQWGLIRQEIKIGDRKTHCIRVSSHSLFTWV